MASEIAVNNVTPLPAPQHSPQTYAVRTSSILANPEQVKINMRAAEMFAASDLVPNHYRGKPANCFIAINRAQRLGVDEMYFLEKTFIVGGKLGMAAELAIELANASGRFRGQIKFRLFGEGEARGCTAFATLASDGETVENTVTYAMAKADGWTKNNKWNSLRDQMLQYRAGVFLARLYAGGSMGGMYTREELEDVAAQSAKPIGSGTTGQERIEDQVSGQIEHNADPVEPAMTREEIEKFESDVADKLETVTDLGALDDYWRSGINARVRELGATDKAAMNRIISRFSQTKNAILKKLEDGYEGSIQQQADRDQAEHADEMEREAPQKPVQADPEPAAAKPRDQIDNALDALRKGDDEPAGKIPAPVAITVMKNADGSPNWSGFFNAAKAQIIQATDGEHGDAWLVEWLKANDESLAGLRQANPKAADKLNGMYMQSLEYQQAQRKEAEDEALAEFPTLSFTYPEVNGEKSETPDWHAFLKDLYTYLRNTPNHRIAAAWWQRHTFQIDKTITNDAERVRSPVTDKVISGKEAAAEFKAALFARFPRLAG